MGRSIYYSVMIVIISTKKYLYIAFLNYGNNFLKEYYQNRRIFNHFIQNLILEVHKKLKIKRSPIQILALNCMHILIILSLMLLISINSISHNSLNSIFI